MNKADYILFSGAAPGAEAEFGACAERHGIEEVNFTFDGHTEARRRGIRVLNHEELQAGDVSLEYVSKLMHRRYTDSPTMRKILQTLWYQVNSGQEIYVVGVIQDDGTVRGGTGWGAEFAKLCNKPLCVFDQEKDGWFCWTRLGLEGAGTCRRSRTRTSPAPARGASTRTARRRSKRCSQSRSDNPVGAQERLDLRPVRREGFPYRPAPVIDRLVALRSRSRGHDVDRGDRSAPRRQGQFGPLSFAAPHLHVRALNLPSGKTLLEMQVEAGEGERESDRFATLDRVLRRPRVDDMLVDERRADVRQRVSGELVKRLEFGCHSGLTPRHQLNRKPTWKTVLD